MKLSIIIPAFNEEKCLPETLVKIYEAAKTAKFESEIIVVDNDSADKTGEIATGFGAKVIFEKEHNIGRVRNAGAKAAFGEILIFIDADTRVPPELFQKICQTMKNDDCFGGAVAVGYEDFERKWMRFYLFGWKFWSYFFNMKQGAAQFCRKSIFSEIGGYDENFYIGEDVEFYWRLSNRAKKLGGYLRFINDLQVVTSNRRFDKMNVWKTLVFTNPLFLLFTAKKKQFWSDWYDKPVR